MKDTKTEIFNAALTLFSEKSYHGASIRDIAKKIGKRESSIYNHFSSKEEILTDIISNFSNRNFGKIILTDELINQISKPEKFFSNLGMNLMGFWNSDKERMFIKILFYSNNIDSKEYEYSLSNYLDDFKKFTSIIFDEMIKHKYILKNDSKLLSNEFISFLFLHFIESLLQNKTNLEIKEFVKAHVAFFWNAIKR